MWNLNYNMVIKNDEIPAVQGHIEHDTHWASVRALFVSYIPVAHTAMVN